MNRKILGIFVVMLLIGTVVLPITGAIKNFDKVDIIMSSTSMDTITVDDEGDGDYTSIQDAIDNANPGDTIKVYSGTYIENVVVDKQLAIMGIGGELGIGDDVDKPSIDGGSGDVVHIYADSVNVSGFIIQNGTRGICMEYSNNSTITGNNISDNERDGIMLDGSSDNTITGNNITDNNYYGIMLDGSSENTITGNTIDNNDDGIMLDGSSDNTITVNTIDNNWRAITLTGSSDNTITGNNITDNNYYGISLTGSSDNTITGNNIDNNYYGIRLSSSDNTITGNNITDNNMDGIRLYYSSENTITGNNITDNNYFGIGLTGSSDNTITGNTIDNNDDGIMLDYSSDNNTITGNNIDNNYYGISIDIPCIKNILYLNNLVENNFNVDAGTNQWDNGSHGNYWDDYDDRYPDAQKKWLKGIWDTPYEIPGGNNQDRYPLIKPYSKSKSIPCINLLFLQFLENHPHLFPLLRQLLGLQ